RSRGSSRQARGRDTASDCASGAQWAERARARSIEKSSPRTSRGRPLSDSTRASGRATVLGRVLVLSVLVSVSPPVRLTAQGLFNQFSSENLRLSAVQLDLGPSLKFSEENRSEEHTSELQSRGHLVCRLLLE